jgi:hypothetical protein
MRLSCSGQNGSVYTWVLVRLRRGAKIWKSPLHPCSVLEEARLWLKLVGRIQRSPFSLAIQLNDRRTENLKTVLGLGDTALCPSDCTNTRFYAFNLVGGRKPTGFRHPQLSQQVTYKIGVYGTVLYRWGLGMSVSFFSDGLTSSCLLGDKIHPPRTQIAKSAPWKGFLYFHHLWPFSLTKAPYGIVLHRWVLGMPDFALF